MAYKSILLTRGECFKVCRCAIQRWALICRHVYVAQESAGQQKPLQLEVVLLGIGTTNLLPHQRTRAIHHPFAYCYSASWLLVDFRVDFRAGFRVADAPVGSPNQFRKRVPSAHSLAAQSYCRYSDCCRTVSLPLNQSQRG